MWLEYKRKKIEWFQLFSDLIKIRIIEITLAYFNQNASHKSFERMGDSESGSKYPVLKHCDKRSAQSKENTTDRVQK